MNSKTQAQKGFKTFILTLAISLAVFSGIYYIINTDNSEQKTSAQNSANQESSVLDARVESATDATDTTDTANKSAEDQTADSSTNNENEKSQDSVFETLANSKITDTQSPTVAGVSQEKAVLSGSDQATTTETSQSTVPVTGISGPTVGIILTLVILSLVAYIYFVGPRKMALSSFEKDLLDDLD
jgi:cobalamin biosynthesis Mg chelatase CobN